MSKDSRQGGGEGGRLERRGSGKSSRHAAVTGTPQEVRSHRQCVSRRGQWAGSRLQRTTVVRGGNGAEWTVPVQGEGDWSSGIAPGGWGPGLGDSSKNRHSR